MAKLSAAWARVPTLSEPASPDDLGIVSLHEHLLFSLPGWWCAPEVVFDRAAAFERICTSLQSFKEHGGGTIVDTSGITLGRNVPFYSSLARAVDARIIAATGFDSEPLSIPVHFCLPGLNYYVPGPFEPLRKGYADTVWQRDVPGNFYPSHGGSKEYLMFLFYNELTKGMVAPGMIRTKIRAGMVTAGCSWDQITVPEELSVRGAALAAKRAGVAVYATGIKQSRRLMEILLEEGLEPNRIIIGHGDDGRAIDLERDKEFARRGAYVAYDHIGWEDASVPHGMPDGRRVEMVKAMVEAGFAEHIVLSCSAIGYAIGMPQSRHSFSHLLESFVPEMRKAGVREGVIDTILRENPKRILARG